MTLNGKRDDLTTDDLLIAARSADVKPRAAKAIITRITETLQCWPTHARQAQVPENFQNQITTNFRLLSVQ